MSDNRKKNPSSVFDKLDLYSLLWEEVVRIDWITGSLWTRKQRRRRRLFRLWPVGMLCKFEAFCAFVRAWNGQFVGNLCVRGVGAEIERGIMADDCYFFFVKERGFFRKDWADRSLELQDVLPDLMWDVASFWNIFYACFLKVSELTISSETQFALYWRAFLC